MQIPQIIFTAAGILTIISGLTKAGFSRRKAQRMIKLLGEVGTQVLYILIGIALIVIAFTVDLGTL